MNAPLPIRLDDVSFRPGGRPVIAGLSAAIETAGITGVIGPNGAGKSVMLRLLDGLLRPDGGAIRFGDRGAESVRRAFVFQRPGLLRASVARNAALALWPERLPRAQARARVAAALRRVGLEGRAGEAARKLSGGEQQRLALARAWLTRPEVLLLDEPTASLDPGATEAVERLMLDMVGAGVKVVLVSHNLGQIARLAEDVLVLSAGRAVEHGPARTVLHTPRAPETRAYLGGELPWTPFAAA